MTPNSMKPKRRKAKAGDVLMAQPFMTDTNFKRAVVGLCEHNKEGSLGFILNKPINMKLTELISDVESDEAFEVYYGGPVATDTLHYIHNVGDLLDDSVKVTQGVYWGGDFEKLKFLIASGMILKENIRFYIGYSGWTSGQLENELTYGSWILSDLYSNYIFKSKASTLWQQAIRNKGNTFSVIAQIPNYISFN